MTPRELVRRTVEFAKPARVPRQAWVLPWAEEHHPADVLRLRQEFPDDIVTAPGLYRQPLPVQGERYKKGLYIDEWGCRFDNVHGGVIGIVREPLIREWDDLDRFRTPDCTLAVDREAVNAFCASTQQFVLAGTLVRPFERYCFIRTTEQALVDLFRRPAEFHDLLGRLHEHYIREVEAWSATDVDGIVLMDDWGAQDRMLVSPVLWRDVFKPIYRDYCDVARQAGKFVFMHSDGRITEIVNDLIEVGVQALNSQVKGMGVAELGRRFRGRLTFWGEIDRQEVLPLGTLEDIRGAVCEMREHLYANGGVIGQCEFGPGASPDNVFEVFRAWRDLDAR
ncbi:MAG: methyltransferase [Acidobacteria bacterium]|nr:MAG: methyltransferase [Acidobacteriota bacterium]